MERRKAILRAIGRGFLRGLMLILRLVPYNSSLAIGRFFGNLMRITSKKRYRIALRNLDIAYGDTKSQEEKIRIAKESFRQFGMFAVESIKSSQIPPEEVEERIEMQLYDDLTHLLKMNKGCLMLTGHLGNFELGAKWLELRHHDLYALMREARDQGTTEIMNDLRRKNGITPISIRGSIKSILQALKRNQIIAIICDQNASDVYVPFFGHMTGTADGPARISLKMSAPILFFAGYRTKPGFYRYQSFGSLLPESTGDEKADIIRITTEINAKLEEMIREHPEQWLWFHNRWKSSNIGVTPTNEATK